jgi:hypothetical protein
MARKLTRPPRITPTPLLKKLLRPDKSGHTKLTMLAFGVISVPEDVSFNDDNPQGLDGRVLNVSAGRSTC